jgi:hypothetical protein
MAVITCGVPDEQGIRDVHSVNYQLNEVPEGGDGIVVENSIIPTSPPGYKKGTSFQLVYDTNDDTVYYKEQPAPLTTEEVLEDLLVAIKELSAAINK